MNLVTLAVEEASQQENDDEQNRQDDSPAFCEPAKVFLGVVRFVRFSHQCSIPCVGVRGHPGTSVFMPN